MRRYLVIFTSVSVTGYFATVMMNQTFEWMNGIAFINGKMIADLSRNQSTIILNPGILS